MAESVLGVDACPAGWIGVWLCAGRSRTVLERRIVDLLGALGPDRQPSVIAIDIPIGLPTDGVRRADVEARRALKGKASSVFNTLPRAVYEAETYAEARGRCVELTGRSTSAQGWRLGPKVLEVADWMPARPGLDVIEVHPELSFATMGSGESEGRPVLESKKDARGIHLRRELLAGHGIVPEPIEAKGYATDDLLDAAACAWSARRRLAGHARSYPDPPEALSVPAAIWV